MVYLPYVMHTKVVVTDFSMRQYVLVKRILIICRLIGQLIHVSRNFLDVKLMPQSDMCGNKLRNQTSFIIQIAFNVKERLLKCI